MLKISGPCKFRKKEDYKSVLAEQNCVSFLKPQSGQSASVFEMKTLTLFTMGFFGAAHGRGGGPPPKRPPLPKICHRYSTMMKLGTVIPFLKKIQKTYKSRDTALAFY